MIDITLYDWCKLMRLYSVKNIHPMFNYHYASALKRLDRLQKSDIKDTVSEYITTYEPVKYTNNFYRRLYPILLCMSGRVSNKYTGIVSEVVGDRHSEELNMTHLMVKNTIADMWEMFFMLAIHPETGSYFSRQEHEIIESIQKMYKGFK